MRQVVLARKSAVAPSGTKASKAASGDLRISEPNDAFEQEADRVADEVIFGGQRGVAWSLSRASICVPLQRQCECGGWPRDEEKCEERKREGSVRRREASAATPTAISRMVREVLRSSGQPLDPTTRMFFESRFGYDFGHVRVHADARSAESARTIGAHAYAVGQHVAFGQSRYQPATAAGRHLLAHELAHVVQQSVARPAGLVQRRGIFETIGIFLGLTEGNFSDKELHDYLVKVTAKNHIEDSYDSDNKARAIVRKWKTASAGYNLTGIQKALLIREMATGYVGGEDQRGILDLLENSDDADLHIIFTSGGIKASRLVDDFGGKQLKELRQVFDLRFKGGQAALLMGQVEPQAGAAAAAPRFPYSWPILKAKIEAGALPEELLSHISAFTSDERTQVVKDVSGERVKARRQLTDLADKFEKEVDPSQKKVLQDRATAIAAFVRNMDFVLQSVSKDVALVETPASLSAKTTAPTAAEKAEIKEALKPDVKRDVAGNVLAFVSLLPGELKNYEEKLREFIPVMIDNLFTKLVVGKGPAEHADPAKVHSLKELEGIGNVSKRETDAVFGSYKTGPPLKADTATKRGNIHDLWADTQKELAGLTKGQRRSKARQLMFYFFQSNSGIQKINRAHNADPKFSPSNTEGKALEKLADEFTETDAQVKKLNQIDRGWPASAGGGEINVQLFKKPTSDADRDFLWDMFQTLIHEYLHTLVHPNYRTFASSFGGRKSNQFNTLIEGVDSYLDEVVWTNIQPRVNDPALRKEIEGPVDSLKPPIEVKPASRRRYPSYTEAVKLVNIVGPRNLYAAYFLGETDKLGA